MICLNMMLIFIIVNDQEDDIYRLYLSLLSSLKGRNLYSNLSCQFLVS